LGWGARLSRAGWGSCPALVVLDLAARVAVRRLGDLGLTFLALTGWKLASLD
jgi:hypothetical protein